MIDATSPILKIQRIVAELTGLSVAEITGQSRERSVVRARWAAIYIARHVAKQSFAAIERRFQRNDKTIRYALDQVLDLRAQNEHYAAIIDLATVKYLQEVGAYENHDPDPPILHAGPGPGPVQRRPREPRTAASD